MERPAIIDKVPGIRIAANIGHFLFDRLIAPDGWSNLPPVETRPARPPVRANITYYSTPEAPGAVEREA